MLAALSGVTSGYALKLYFALYVFAWVLSMKVGEYLPCWRRTRHPNAGVDLDLLVLADAAHGDPTMNPSCSQCA